MSCERIRSEIGAWRDGELAPEAAVRVQRHVESCPACRAEAERAAALDRELAAAMADFGDGASGLERTLAAVAAAEVRDREGEPPRAGRALRARPWILGAAAGLLAGFGLATWWQTREAPPPPPRPAVAWVVARAGAEPPPGGDAFAPPAALATGAVLRTGSRDQLAIAFDGGGEARLDRETRVELRGRRRLRLETGRIALALPPAAEPVDVEGAGGLVVAIEGHLAIEHVPARPDAKDAAAGDALAVVVVRGSARAGDIALAPGTASTLRAGTAEPPSELFMPSQALAFALPLLAGRPEVRDELDAAVAALLEELVVAKGTDDPTAHLRALGEDGAASLARWLRRAPSGAAAPARAAAARALAALAGPTLLPDLLDLVGADDPASSEAAHHALQRITGEDVQVAAKMGKLPPDALRKVWEARLHDPQGPWIRFLPAGR